MVNSVISNNEGGIPRSETGNAQIGIDMLDMTFLVQGIVEAGEKIGQALCQNRPVSAPAMLKRGFSRVEAAEYIGISTGTFDRMITDGQMPKPVQTGRRKIWDIRALDAAFDALSDRQNRNPWDE